MNAEKTQKKILREGYSTGTTTAAAAYAAVLELCRLNHSSPALPAVATNTVNVKRPPFSVAPLASLSEHQDISVSTEIVAGTANNTRAYAVKDGGDDPDATHGAKIYVSASFSPATFANEQGSDWLELYERVFIKTGQGIGIVTLPGLPVKPGEPAVNPEPRRQIAFMARLAARVCNYSGSLYLFVCIPDGESRAKKTINARLGILGGISILGTRGTVRPFSHEAWEKTIMTSLAQAKELQLDTIVFSTGRRSEEAGMKLFPALSGHSFIQIADFAHYALNQATCMGFKNIIWLCHAGKLIKLAQGSKYTHAKTDPLNMQLFINWSKHCGFTDKELLPVQQIPTAQGTFDYLASVDGCRLQLLAEKIAEMALFTLAGWKANKANSNILLCVLRSDSSLWLQTGTYNKRDGNDSRMQQYII